MRSHLLALASAAALASLAAADFQPTPSPVSPDGTPAVIDLPASQHMRNVGGSDGAGLCVFTSIQHSAYWQNIRALDGYREWMRRRPGGGWPQKVDATLAQFCKEKGVQLPPYVQHTGGDEEFLRLALKTGRLPAVTYCGLDDFYRDRWGRPARIAHMVSLAHLDGTRAAIIDNNRPGYWVWMTREEFQSRWRGNSGGWAVVFLDPPPPPHLPAPKKVEAGGCGTRCVCGDDCTCKPGACPNRCPVVVGQKWGVGGCGPVGPLAGPLASPLPAASPEPVGESPSAEHEWGRFEDGAWGWRLKAKAEALTGVVPEKVHDHPPYSISGRPCSKAEAHAAFGGALADDSDRWHLTAVGDAALLRAFSADVAALPADLRAKLLVQAYSPDRWEVGLFRLPPGVSLRTPSPGRTAAQVGAVAPAEYGAAALADLLASEGGPAWKPKPPAPLAGPKQPDPAPAPAPRPDSPQGSDGWCYALLAALVFLIREVFVTRKK